MTATFDTHGHPGKWIQSVAVTGTLDATGSAFGVAGLIVSGSATGTATLSAGGDIPITTFTSGEIYEVSVSKLVVNSGTVHALYKRHNAI